MNIPESTIQAAARALYGFVKPLDDEGRFDDYDTDDPAVQRTCREGAAAILVAALATCTVREQWRAKIAHASGSVSVTMWFGQQEHAADEATWLQSRYPDARYASVESRLVIETAAIPQPERTTGE
jgi:hypothetical protein